MELVKVGKKTYYIKNATNIGSDVVDIDKDNFEMIDGGKLDYIYGQLNITKNYLEVPKKTAVERSRKRLLLRLIYPDDKKWF